MNIVQLPDSDDKLQVVRYEDLTSRSIVVPDSGGTLTEVTYEQITKPMITSNPGDKVPGIYSALFLRTQDTNTPVGNYKLYTSAVAAGYIWHVQSICLFYGGTVTGRIFAVHVNDGASDINYYATNALTSLGYLTIPSNFYLLAGYKLGFGIYACEAGKLMIIDIVGVKMRAVE